MDTQKHTWSTEHTNYTKPFYPRDIRFTVSRIHSGFSCCAACTRSAVLAGRYEKDAKRPEICYTVKRCSKPNRLLPQLFTISFSLFTFIQPCGMIHPPIAGFSYYTCSWPPAGHVPAHTLQHPPLWKSPSPAGLPQMTESGSAHTCQRAWVHRACRYLS